MSVASVGVASASTASHGLALQCGGCGGDGGGDGGGGSGGGGSGGGGSTTGRLRISGTCGDQLTMRIKTVGGPLDVAISIPSADPTEVWSISATEQTYDAVTGGRIGNPVDMMASGIMPPLAFSTIEGGFASEGFFTIPSNRTAGFSYTATRSSPTPLTCTNQGYWTAPAGSPGPVAQNPAGKPDTAPALTGATEADSGANDVALQFDQEMLATSAGTPDPTRFSVTVDGVSRTVTGVTILNDSPPQDAIVDIAFDGAALTAGQTVAVVYRKPLTSGTPALQDMDSLTVSSFGPISVPAF